MNSRALFPSVFCSQCGGEFGPGPSGFSHCIDHKALKRYIVTCRTYRRDGAHVDHIAGELFGPHACVLTAEQAQNRVRYLESSPDRLARVHEFETEAMALDRARLLCGSWSTPRQAA